MCKNFHHILKKLDLLEDLPKPVQQELAIIFVERTLLFSATDDLLSSGIQKFFDSICQYCLRKTSIDDMVKENSVFYRLTLAVERTKYRQKKIDLIFALFRLCCFDELYDKKMTFKFFRPMHTCRYIAFLSRFIKALHTFGDDWDSENLEIRHAARKKGRKISCQEGYWQL